MDGIAELTERLDEHRSLAVNKFNVAQVLSCETHFLGTGAVRLVSGPGVRQGLAPRDQLLLNWRGEPTPPDLVDDALRRLTGEDSSLGRGWRMLSAGDRLTCADGPRPG